MPDAYASIAEILIPTNFEIRLDRSIMSRYDGYRDTHLLCHGQDCYRNHHRPKLLLPGLVDVVVVLPAFVLVSGMPLQLVDPPDLLLICLFSFLLALARTDRIHTC